MYEAKILRKKQNMTTLMIREYARNSSLASVCNNLLNRRLTNRLYG